MVLFLLPAGWTLEEPNEPILEAKEFQGRLAVYWRFVGELGHADLQWRMVRSTASARQDAVSFNRRRPPSARRRSRIDVQDAEPGQGVGWLHLTDLHAGMSAERPLWDNVENYVLEDLKTLHDDAGPWDLVFFTGDLTQEGSLENFRRFEEILDKILETLKKAGSTPVFLPPCALL
jgi:hypothetical protein